MVMVETGRGEEEGEEKVVKALIKKPSPLRGWYWELHKTTYK